MSVENKKEGQIRLGIRQYNSWRIWNSEKSWKHGQPSVGQLYVELFKSLIYYEKKMFCIFMILGSTY